MATERIDIKSNYELVNELISKNNGLYLPPNTYSKYANLASYGYFNTLVGLRNNPSNISNYGASRKLDGRLGMFKGPPVEIPLVDGYMEIPDDFSIVLALYTSGDKPIPIKPVDEDRYAMAHQDPFRTPTNTRPIYKDLGDAFKVVPHLINPVVLEYLSKPREVKYAYTLVNGRPKYDEDNSVGFEWDKTQEAEITMRILQYVGISMTSAEIVQFASAKQQEE